MALATKCPHCNTIFRVAQDQLKLRGGIVRCGACNEVFDGNAALVEPASLAPLPAPLPPATPVPAPLPATAELDLELDTLDDDGSTMAPMPLPPGAPIALPDEITALNLDFEDEDAAASAPAAPAPAAAGLAPPELAESAAAELESEEAAGAQAVSEDAEAAEAAEVATAEAETTHARAVGAAPTAQDLLASDMLSEAELQAALEAELAALDARMAAARPATVLEPQLDDAAAGPHDPYAAHDGRREPTLAPPHYGELDEVDEQALLHLASAASQGPRLLMQDDIPPSHTLLRTRSSPAADRPDAPAPAADAYYTAAPPAPPAAAVDALHSFAPPHLHADATTPPEPVHVGANAAATADRIFTDAAVQAAAPAFDATATDHADAAPASDDEPGFLKHARRRQRYGKPVAIAMALGTVVLLGALAAQGVTTFRNQLAASIPALKPALVALCKGFGCTVALPAQIDALAIEQGELQTLSETTFSFATALRNSSNSAQAWPHIELVLDDANDKTVLRRVFGPRDYLGADVAIDKGFPARSEQAVKLYFELNQLKASGYHIAVFYP